MKKIFYGSLLSLLLIACGGSEKAFTGTYNCADCVYKELKFQENGEVSINAGGIVAKGTFEVVDKTVTISTETADYVFDIKDNDTLIGKDEAKGTYKISK